jgi:hypothetical protein
VEGVPEQFFDERQRAFSSPGAIAGVELYHAHISRYAFEPHTHEAFGIGAIEAGAERFRYRGTQYVAPANSVVTMNPELSCGSIADCWKRWFSDGHDPLRGLPPWPVAHRKKGCCWT